MSSFINVTSEIGALKKVLLHRPGTEVENLIPEYLGRLLFDDIPYLKVAREEHDYFARVLRDNGVEVLYLEDLTADALSQGKLKHEFVDEFLVESGITSLALKDTLSEYLLNMSLRDMIDKIISGIRREEVKVKEISSLSQLTMEEYPFYLDPMPNLYFTRDPSTTIGTGMSLNKARWEARRRETLFIKYIVKHHPSFKSPSIPLWYHRDEEFAIEGGDILVLSDKVLAIGCSERTSAEAIEVLGKNLFREETSYETILVFEIPKIRAFMHLDTVFTMIDHDKFTIHPGIQGPLSVFEVTRGAGGKLNFKHDAVPVEETLKKALKLSSIQLLKCGGGDPIIAGREQWNDGSNTLAVAPGVVITYERNYVSNELFDKAGVKVLAIPSSELSRGRGGPRCMSMPLERANIKIGK
jgi:arginine deiminase